jgi:hypothetical protein
MNRWNVVRTAVSRSARRFAHDPLAVAYGGKIRTTSTTMDQRRAPEAPRIGEKGHAFEGHGQSADSQRGIGEGPRQGRRTAHQKAQIEMSETLHDLQLKMDAAARALDFEEAKRCRDKISLIRGGATASEAEQADLLGIERQQPGAMGLGTSQQRVTPPKGWQPPPKPDPMTSGQTVRRKPRKG